MMAEAVFFYIFTSLMLLAGGCVVLGRKPTYSVLALLAVMFCMSALFVLLGAYVVAALQVLLYAGAVLVLFLFVIMLLNLSSDEVRRARVFTKKVFGLAVAAILAGLLIPLLFSPAGSVPLSRLPKAIATVEAIGEALFTQYLLPFELTSFLILAAMIGAVTLSKQESQPDK